MTYVEVPNRSVVPIMISFSLFNFHFKKGTCFLYKQTLFHSQISILLALISKVKQKRAKMFSKIVVLLIVVVAISEQSQIFCPNSRFTEKHLCPQCNTANAARARALKTARDFRPGDQQNTETIFKGVAIGSDWTNRNNICTSNKPLDCYVIRTDGSCRKGKGNARHSALNRNGGHLAWQLPESCRATENC